MVGRVKKQGMDLALMLPYGLWQNYEVLSTSHSHESVRGRWAYYSTMILSGVATGNIAITVPRACEVLIM